MFPYAWLGHSAIHTSPFCEAMIDEESGDNTLQAIMSRYELYPSIYVMDQPISSCFPEENQNPYVDDLQIW